ncbi:hypothetical protein [Thiosulfatihalobacter marinus]|jgi:hypothetical protein|uniref:hypothetical protein n=1 Tax=Thiosulfatihalobacter marinus TaxID=2792481 RepID=UPI0018D81CD5|nr:hypothetical protein [Thiosulfatihalobacter marinus]
MNALVRFGAVGAENWNSLVAQPAETGYAVSETTGKFRHTSRNEAILRFVGIVIVLGALIQWSFPNASFAGDPMTTKIMMSVASALIGMAVYSFATRGHRSEIRFDPRKNELVVSALNRQDRHKAVRRVPLSQVKSIYVRRTDMPHGMAALRIRFFNNPNELTAIRGTDTEIEMLHGLLCRDIRMARKQS